MTRYPLEPLAQAMGLSLHAACAQLGISGTTQKEYRARGVTVRVADRLAVKAGYHPAEIWPTWIDDAIADEPPAYVNYKDCAECGQPFEASSPRRRFCKPQCRKNHHTRAWKATPEGRRRNQETRRKYYAENRRYELARQRRYDHATKNKNNATTRHAGPHGTAVEPETCPPPRETVHPTEHQGEVA